MDKNDVQEAEYRCTVCGFRADDWNDEDTVNTIRLALSLVDLWASPSIQRLRLLNTRR